jgi:putative FmdB family regulatory protein
VPTYEYQCAECGERLEAVQSFSDSPLTDCPKCSKPALRKLFGNVGVVFKGSGFYRNDSRAEGRAKSEKSDQASAKKTDPDSKTSKTESGTKSDTTTKAKPDAGSSSSGTKGASSDKGSGKSTTTKK